MRVLVPTGRFELPHLAALAPQASVSTNSTTSAQNRIYLPAGGAGGGTVPVAGADGGAPRAGVLDSPCVAPLAPAAGEPFWGAALPKLTGGAPRAGRCCVSAAVSKIVFGASVW